MVRLALGLLKGIGPLQAKGDVVMKLQGNIKKTVGFSFFLDSVNPGA
jgi:hypothetical protein